MNSRALEPVTWRQSDAIKKGVGQANQLHVMIKGDKATAYINDTEVATLVGTQVAQRYTPAELSQLVGAFEGSIDDVFKTLVVNGYGRSQEYHADESALSYLSKSGYDPLALGHFLGRLVSQGQASGEGMMKTHPATAERIERVKREMPSVNVDAFALQLRTKRFQEAKIPTP